MGFPTAGKAPGIPTLVPTWTHVPNLHMGDMGTLPLLPASFYYRCNFF